MEEFRPVFRHKHLHYHKFDLPTPVAVPKKRIQLAFLAATTGAYLTGIFVGQWLERTKKPSTKIQPKED